MNAEEETFKRVKIARGICSQLQTIAKGVLLGGSMGYGQNYSVNKKSDIDMVVVCDKGYARDLKSTSFLSDSISEDILKFFEDGVINMFWSMNEFDSIKINSFIYEAEGYKKICKLEESIRGYIPAKIADTQTSYGFDGKALEVKRDIWPYKDGCFYKKPVLVEGKYWGGPPRSDFLIESSVLYQENNFFDFVRQDTWNATLKQLVKEYGPDVDLNHANIINTDFTYQRNPDKIPSEVVEEVKRQTNYRLDNLGNL